VVAELRAPKRKLTAGAWEEARALVWAHRQRLALGLALTVVSRLAGLVLPVSSKWLIDTVVGKGRWDLLPKLAEETAELEAEAAASEKSDDPAIKAAVEAELGDLLFTVVNLGRHLGVDAEMALRGTNARFRQRFGEMENAASQSLGKPLSELPPEQLEALWSGAKEKLRQDQSAIGAGK